MNSTPEEKKDHGREAIIRETEDPVVWELEWQGVPTLEQARRIIKWAENSILPRGGETLAFTCGEDQAGMLSELERWPESMVSRNGERCEIKFVEQDHEGLIHDDRDCRTPLTRINCPTCVERIIHARTRKREESLGKNEGPGAVAQHSRRIAEGYTRLAEVEEELAKRRERTPQPGEPEPGL